MRLSDIKGEYDIAISLGAACQVAEQLKRHNLRTFSGPFDWTVIEAVDRLIMAIDNRFRNYFHMDHLENHGKHDHTWLIFDREYHCMSVHDFPLGPEDQVFANYPQFIEKMTRRINRFYEKTGQSGKTLFVRMHATYDDAVRLSECLRKLTDDRYTLIVVNETESFDFIEEDWEIPNTYAARVRQTPDMPWQGFDPHWDKILNGISVREIGRILFSAKGNSAFYLGEGWHDQEDGHRWTSRTAELVLPVVWDKPRVMKLKAWSFPHSGKTEVYCNDTHIGTIENHPELHAVKFAIPEKSINSCGKQIIRFVTERAVSPSEAGVSEDARVLGIGVQSVEFCLLQETEA